MRLLLKCQYEQRKTIMEKLELGKSNNSDSPSADLFRDKILKLSNQQQKQAVRAPSPQPIVLW